jgi:hypothetical protein
MIAAKHERKQLYTRKETDIVLLLVDHCTITAVNMVTSQGGMLTSFSQTVAQEVDYLLARTPIAHFVHDSGNTPMLS